MGTGEIRNRSLYSCYWTF